MGLVELDEQVTRRRVEGLGFEAREDVGRGAQLVDEAHARWAVPQVLLEPGPVAGASAPSR